jgi:hypothetical protein
VGMSIGLPWIQFQDPKFEKPDLPSLFRIISCNAFGSRIVVLPLTANVESLYPGEAVVTVKGKAARTLGDHRRLWQIRTNPDKEQHPRAPRDTPVIMMSPGARVSSSTGV